MRINKYVALATGLGRRKADELIDQGRVKVNGLAAKVGQPVDQNDSVLLDGQTINLAKKPTVIVLNKPIGYVCSRDGQGSRTIYELLPKELQKLKPVGRLDKDSSGLLLLTDDGQLAQQLTHPSFQKQKIYIVELDKQLVGSDQTKIEKGVQLDDGLSRLELKGSGQTWQITMSEGRNRQIRRTFAALGYMTKSLHRIKLGDYELPNNLTAGEYSKM